MCQGILRETGGVFAWAVLALVFLDELFAVAAAVTWGRWASGWLLGAAAGLAVVVVWFLFASPRARFGHPVGRPVVKVAVFTLASLGLAVAGHPGWALALLGFSAVVNGLAQLPSVRAAAAEASPRG